MLTYFLVCPAAIEADSSVNFNAALSLPKNTNRNNITERNGGGKKSFLWAVLLWNMQSCPLSWSSSGAMRSASSAFGMATRHHSKLNVSAQIDVDLWCPSCPLHPYLSSPSGCICKYVLNMKCQPPIHSFLLSQVQKVVGRWSNG